MADGMTTAGMAPFLRGNYAPVFDELDVAALTVRGELPRGLAGTLYRNGPNPHFPTNNGHWFTGDGMLHAFAIENGKAGYRNRWVRTPKWQLENAAGRALYTGFGGRAEGAPADSPMTGGVANTHIVRHGGRLLALEEQHLPTEIDPRSLDTLGVRDFGMLKGPFTAHPKIDPATGELLFFGYNAAGPFTPELSFGMLDAKGAVSRYEHFEAPYASMVHDFMMTERHVLFPVLPLTGSMERTMAGGAPYAWEPDRGAYVGVVRRDGTGADVRWFRGEAAYAFHVMNAWEEGDRIVAEVMAFDEPPLFPHADGSPGDPVRQRARLTRWTFDLASPTDRFASAAVDDLSGEFPRIDDRVAGSAHRHGWFACARPGKEALGLDGIAHIDGLGGARRTFWLPEGDGISEPVFAPRGEEEGDGWILAVAWRAATASSELMVFESRDIEAGPIATVEAPRRVPFGFHGAWVDQGEMA